MSEDKATRPHTHVRVKRLEWYSDPGAFPYKTWGAQSSFGRFLIEEVNSSDCAAYEARYTTHHLITITDGLPEAQEACQSDYERRIHSALLDDVAGEAVKIADAVLTWLASHELVDAGNEYRAIEVIEILNGIVAPPLETKETLE